MKLRLVSARTGATWVKLGVKTFFRQPLALGGLFFMFLALISVASLVPLVGLPLGMTILPAVTLGLMAGAREADTGKFPMPLILLSAFRTDSHKVRAMLALGAFYAFGFMVSMGLSWLVDGGSFARMYLGGETPSAETLGSAEFQSAMWVFIGVHLPVSLMFWHAPALVYWQGLPAPKSMFFSIVACFRNFWALTVFGLCWMAMMVLAVLLVTALSTVLAQPALAGSLLFPVLMLVAAMFFTSMYFTYRDSFEPAPDAPVLPS